jgi:signal recognition particle subunit SRP54
MFNNLSDKLSQSLRNLQGIGRLTEDNIEDSLREVRTALIEADVALSVIKTFIAEIKEKALGQEVLKSIKPGETLIKLVQDELIHILGDETTQLTLTGKPPVVILLAGLQGAGKTTTAAKLAKILKEKERKSVMLVSTDVYRPAAIDQLEQLAKQVGVDFFKSDSKQDPVKIAEAAIEQARRSYNDIVIVDTAGRLHIDDALMIEIKAIHKAIKPINCVLVVDSMAGQDAANSAKIFNDSLELSGIILTKADGDARGGAALSMRTITQKPILYIGTGEKIDGLEPFHPKRIASRILGMGDIVSLVEAAQTKVDKDKAEKFAEKIKKGERFDFNDFVEQLQQLKKMGGMQSMLDKLPNMPNIPNKAMTMFDDKLTIRMEAIVGSMTKKERAFPALINGSRKKRIAGGSGTSIQDVNKLIKQFTQMQKMMKKFKGNKMMNKLNALRGKLPPDMLNQLPDEFK